MPRHTQADQFADAQIRHQIGLLRFAGGVGGRIVRMMDEGIPGIMDRIREDLDILTGDGVNVQSSSVQRRIRRLRADIVQMRTDQMADIRREIENEARDLAAAQWVFLGAAVAAVFPGLEPDAFLSRSEALAITRTPFAGRTLTEHFGVLGQTDAGRIAEQVSIGVIQGDNPRQIERRVVGTRGLRGRDGVTQTGRNAATSLARTAVTAVAAQSARGFANANESILRAERYTAVLDGRTTPICRALDGLVFPVGEGPIPPLHWGCRSVRLLLFVGQPDPEIPTYSEWLARQPAAFQDEILGPTRGALFRRGDLPLDRFVDMRTGRQRTLSELARFDADAFRDAGLDPGDFAA